MHTIVNLVQKSGAERHEWCPAGAFSAPSGRGPSPKTLYRLEIAEQKSKRFESI